MRDEDFAGLGLQAPPARIDPPVGPPDLVTMLDHAVRACPDDLALSDGRQHFTFAELGHAVDHAAAHFSAVGLKPADRIAASLGNECNLVIAFFAAMRFGAIWVGINKILPAQDKRFILDHSGARLLLTDTTLADQVGALRASLPGLEHVWYLDDEARDGGWAAAQRSTGAAAFVPVGIDPFAPAVINYTSGTTGVPKGVVHSQHNMIVASAAPFAHGLLSQDAVRGSVLPLTITNLMMIGPVSAFWACKPFKFGPPAKVGPLVEWLHRENIGLISIVPTLAYDLLHADLDLPKGVTLGSGGAPLPQPVREAFAKRHGFEITLSYGLTEAPTVVAHSMGLPAPEGASGKAFPQFELTIRHPETGHVLPAGETGEICFRATQSGPWANVYTPPLGYWREAEKTAALLRGGVVHSGDHGWLSEDGWLHVADRSSELILRGGSNVYPAEIERVLHEHPDVADCAVIGKPDMRMGMLTVACILPARPDVDQDLLLQELRAICAERLVRYKMPDLWTFLAEFPRNAMGKVVKPKLREQVLEML